MDSFVKKIQLLRDTEFVVHYANKTTVCPSGTILNVIDGKEGLVVLDGDYANHTRWYDKTIHERLEICRRNRMYQEEVERLAKGYKEEDKSYYKILD